MEGSKRLFEHLVWPENCSREDKLASLSNDTPFDEHDECGEHDEPGETRVDEDANALLLTAPATVAQGQPADPVDALMAELNAQYTVVNENGAAVIYAPKYDPQLNRRYFQRMGFNDFRKLYMNRQIAVGTNATTQPPILKPAAEVWLSHPQRRQYIGGVIFDPSNKHVGPDMLNLWQGFAVKPQPGSWELMKWHLLEVICAGDQMCYDYLIGWMARMIQRPDQQGEVAVIMRGGEGTGKGTLARALLHLVGQHGMAITNSKHLTGNFNGHLRDCVFLFADEAFYAGDPSHVGVLKSIITEPMVTMEAKYQNPVPMPNFLHLMMASNEEWVVPASLDSRRFFVLQVSDAHAKDTSYFDAIWQEMEAGGYEAMLHDLLHYNLTGFNVRNVPDTQELQEQRKLSLGTADSWWMDVLHRGYVYESRLGLDETFSTWQETVATDLLFASYTDYAKRRNERSSMARGAFGRFLTNMGGTRGQFRNIPVGERMAEVIMGSRVHGYRLGTLAEARTAFTKKTNLTQDWPTDDQADDPDEELVVKI